MRTNRSILGGGHNEMPVDKDNYGFRGHLHRFADEEPTNRDVLRALVVYWI